MHIQKKRQELRLSIRRESITNIFKQRRLELIYQHNDDLLNNSSQQTKVQIQNQLNDLILFMRQLSSKNKQDISMGKHKQIISDIKQLYLKIKQLVIKLSKQNLQKLLNIYFQLRFDFILVECSMEIFSTGTNIDKEEIGSKSVAIMNIIYRKIDEQPLQFNHKMMHQFLFQALNIKWDSKHFLNLFSLINSLIVLIPSTKYTILFGIGYEKCIISSVCFIMSRLKNKPDNILTLNIIQIFFNYFNQMIQLKLYHSKINQKYLQGKNKQIPVQQKQNIRFKALQINNGQVKNCLSKEQNLLILQTAIQCFDCFCLKMQDKDTISTLIQSVELIKLIIECNQLKTEKVKLNYSAIMEIMHNQNASAQLKSELLYLIDFIIYQDNTDSIAKMLVEDKNLVKLAWSNVVGHEVVVINILSNLLLIKQCRYQISTMVHMVAIWLDWSPMLLKCKIQFVYNYFVQKNKPFQIDSQLDKLVLTILQKQNDIPQYTKQLIQQQSLFWYKMMQSGYKGGLPSKFRQMEARNMFTQAICSMISAQEYFSENRQF